MAATVEQVREAFRLDPDTGLLLWANARGSRAKAGAVAGTGSGERRFIRFEGQTYSARTLKYVFVNGQWPDGFVDLKTGRAFASACALKGAPLTVERLRQALNYDPQTGVFTWADRTAKCIRIGGVAGSPTSNGYWRIFVDGSEYMAHRLAWFYVHGTWPTVIDHIDGARQNNRIANLRDVTSSVNSQNLKKATKRNATGLLGAFRRTKNSYRAVINIDGKNTLLGSFRTAEDAHAAYLDAKRRHHAGCTI